MYEWITKVNKLVQSLTGEANSLETRKNVTADVVNILNEAGVTSRVDCSSRVNTAEVINHGEFLLVVDTKEITHTFKYVKESK